MKKAGAVSILFVVVLLAVGLIADAQQPKKVPRIGILHGASASSVAARTEAFREGLRELGHHGHISFTAEVDNGSIFIISLPLKH